MYYGLIERVLQIGFLHDTLRSCIAWMVVKP